MKKTYIAPASVVVTAETIEILAASANGVQVDLNSEISIQEGDGFGVSDLDNFKFE